MIILTVIQRPVVMGGQDSSGAFRAAEAKFRKPTLTEKILRPAIKIAAMGAVLAGAVWVFGPNLSGKDSFVSSLGGNQCYNTNEGRFGNPTSYSINLNYRMDTTAYVTGSRPKELTFDESSRSSIIAKMVDGRPRLYRVYINDTTLDGLGGIVGRPTSLSMVSMDVPVTLATGFVLNRCPPPLESFSSIRP